MQLLSAEQIEIVEISISSERFRDNLKLHIAGQETAAPTAVELNIFENIMIPFLTGKLIITDDNDLYRITQLSGTERVKIVLKNPASIEGLIEKTFMITSIRKTVKVNDTTSLLEFDIIENYAYFSDLSPISKSYTGTPIKVVKKILSDNLNLDIVPDYSKEPEGAEIRYIIPWKSPFEAASDVVSKMFTENGLPFFLFSSLGYKERILTDLESILERDPFNKGKPFIYSVGSTPLAGIQGDLTPEQKALIVSDYSSGRLERTLDMAKLGAIGSNYSHLDVNTGELMNAQINMKEEYEKLATLGILPADQNVIPIDTRFRESTDPDGLRTDPLEEYTSRKYFTFSMNAFAEASLEGFYGGETTKRLSIIKNNFIKYMFRNPHTITVPGLLFSLNNINVSVGHQIELQILNSDPESFKLDDEKRSGNYIMTSKQHIIDIPRSRHNVVASIGRIAERPLTT